MKRPGFIGQVVFLCAIAALVATRAPVAQQPPQTPATPDDAKNDEGIQVTSTCQYLRMLTLDADTTTELFVVPPGQP
jgi:hypothetical protein